MPDLPSASVYYWGKFNYIKMKKYDQFKVISKLEDKEQLEWDHQNLKLGINSRPLRELKGRFIQPDQLPSNKSRKSPKTMTNIDPQR